MARLSVNLDHIASIREARGGKQPDPIHAAVIVEQAGADGITLHLRKDRRHINDRDLILIKQVITVPLTLEMAPTPEMLEMAYRVKPNMITLVPELVTELTTERGFTLIDERDTIEEFIRSIRGEGMAVSLFIDPTEDNVKLARELGADYVELNTSRYSESSTYDEEIDSLRELEKAAKNAAAMDLGIAVGHGLNYRNVRNITLIEPVEEYSIGHSIIARAVFVGLERAVQEMMALVK